MTKTIILSPRFSSDSQDMWRAANKAKWNVHRAINYSQPEYVSDCCVYGELMFCDIMADRCDLSLLDPPDQFIEQLPWEYVRRKIEFCNAVTSLSCFKSFGEPKVFVKPANDKVFTYGVYHNARDIPLRYVDENCPILMSSVVSWETEVRLYCLDGKVLTAASYRYIGDRPEEQELKEAEEFGNEVLSGFCNDLPSAVVLDVGRITDQEGWAVVETNQAYASGLYEGADPEKFLEIVYRSAGKRDKVSAHDSKFIRNS